MLWLYRSCWARLSETKIKPRQLECEKSINTYEELIEQIWLTVGVRVGGGLVGLALGGVEGELVGLALGDFDGLEVGFDQKNR